MPFVSVANCEINECVMVKHLHTHDALGKQGKISCLRCSGHAHAQAHMLSTVC